MEVLELGRSNSSGGFGDELQKRSYVRSQRMDGIVSELLLYACDN